MLLPKPLDSEMSIYFIRSYIHWDLVLPRERKETYTQEQAIDEFGLYCAGGEL